MLITAKIVTGLAVMASSRSLVRRSSQRAAATPDAPADPDAPPPTLRQDLLDYTLDGLDSMAAFARRTIRRLRPDPSSDRQARIDGLLGRSTTQPSTRERLAERRIAIAGTSFGFALAGAFVAPQLTLVAAAGTLYSITDALMVVAREWRSDRRIGFAAMVVLIDSSLLLTGRVLLATLLFAVFAVIDRLIVALYDDSRASLMEVLGDLPNRVWLDRDGVAVEVPLDTIEPGDIVIVSGGEMACADGVVIAGRADFDQHMLTGEARHVCKGAGDRVFAGTLALTGRVRILVEEAGADTVADRIGQILHETAGYHSERQMLSERITDASVVPSIGLFAVTLGLLGPSSAIAAITCSIGFQMKVTGPISMMNFLRAATGRGMLVKDGRAFESAHEVDVFIFDKTGTLTEDRLTVTAVHRLDGPSGSALSEAGLLGLAASAEAHQTHPIAKAIVDAATARGVDMREAEHVEVSPGLGISARVDDRVVALGNLRLMGALGIDELDRATAVAERIDARGNGRVILAIDGVAVAVVELSVPVRAEAAQVIAELQARGKRVYIVSGDHEHPTRQLAERLGTNGHFAGVLPDEKGAVVDRFQARGHSVGFVGDGINDAIALKKAHLSISMRGATSVAMDSAQVLLCEHDLRGVVDLLDLSEAYRGNTRQLLVASTVPGVINLGTVYLLHTGVAFAAGMSWLGLGAGLAAAFAPLALTGSQPEAATPTPAVTAARAGGDPPARRASRYATP